MTDEEFTKQRIGVSDGPSLKFEGRIIADASSDPTRMRSQWTEFILWETRGGNWIVQTVACSNIEGQQDFSHALVIERPTEGFGLPERVVAMDFMEWGVTARKIAKAMRWKLVREVD